MATTSATFIEVYLGLVTAGLFVLAFLYLIWWMANHD